MLLLTVWVPEKIKGNFLAEKLRDVTCLEDPTGKIRQ